MNRLIVYSYQTHGILMGMIAGGMSTELLPCNHMTHCTHQMTGPLFQDPMLGWKQPESDNDMILNFIYG